MPPHMLPYLNVMSKVMYLRSLYYYMPHMLGLYATMHNADENVETTLDKIVFKNPFV